MLQNLKTKAKLTILSFIALLAILILGILGTVQLKQVNNGLVRVYNDRVIPLEQLKIILLHLHLIFSSLMKHKDL